MKVKQTMRKRVAGFVRDWSLPRQAAGESHHSDGGEEHDVANAAAAARTGRYGRHQHLPVLRGRVQPADLREERQGDPDRGRPAQPDQPGHALPEGRRDA